MRAANGVNTLAVRMVSERQNAWTGIRSKRLCSKTSDSGESGESFYVPILEVIDGRNIYCQLRRKQPHHAHHSHSWIWVRPVKTLFVFRLIVDRNPC